MNGISPVDNKFFELIIPIATFLTGTLSGIMLASGDKEAQKQALAAANKGWDKPPSPPPQPTVTIGSGGITVSQMPQSGNQSVTLGFGGKPMPPQPQFPEL
jgi:hypothetical protein